MASADWARLYRPSPYLLCTTSLLSVLSALCAAFSIESVNTHSLTHSLTQTLRFGQSAENRNNESQYRDPDEIRADGEAEELAYEGEASPAAADSPPPRAGSTIARYPPAAFTILSTDWLIQGKLTRSSVSHRFGRVLALKEKVKDCLFHSMLTGRWVAVRG